MADGRGYAPFQQDQLRIRELMGREEELRARIATLEKERDEARECAKESAEMYRRNRERNEARVATLEAALRECEDYFDQRADADCAGDPAAYAGNREMTLLGIVRRALRGLEGK